MHQQDLGQVLTSAEFIHEVARLSACSAYFPHVQIWYLPISSRIHSMSSFHRQASRQPPKWYVRWPFTLILFLHAKHSPTARSMKIWRRASTVLKRGRCTHSTLKSPTKVPLTGMEIKIYFDEAFYHGHSRDLPLTFLHRWHRIFLVDLLNFSFWSERDPDDKSVPHPARYAVEYQGVKYTGYWALCACINRGKCWHAFHCLNNFVVITYMFCSF